jgi:hypothetical protein
MVGEKNSGSFQEEESPHYDHPDFLPLLRKHFDSYTNNYSYFFNNLTGDVKIGWNYILPLLLDHPDGGWFEDYAEVRVGVADLSGGKFEKFYPNFGIDPSAAIVDMLDAAAEVTLTYSLG